MNAAATPAPPPAANVRVLLAERMRVCLWIVVASAILFAIADLRLRPELVSTLTGMKVVLVTASLVSLWYSRTPGGLRHIGALSLGMVVLVLVLTSASGVLANDPLTTPFIAIAVTLATASLFPWGAGMQWAAAGAAGLSVLANAAILNGGLMNAFSYPTVGAMVAFFVSVYVAHQSERGRALDERESTRREQAKLQESEERFRQLAENIRDIFWIADPELNEIAYVSPAFEEITGRPRDSLAGNPRALIDFIHPDDRAAAAEALGRLSRGHFTANFGGTEFRLVRPDGSERWMWTRVFPVLDERGKVVRVAGISQDVTERRRLDAEREALLEVANDISGTLDLNEILNRVQRRAAALLPCDQVTTFYWDRPHKAHRMIGQYGIPPEVLPQVEGLLFRPADPIAEHLGRAGTVVINDIAEQSWLPVELLARFRVSSLIGTPLVVRGRVVGAFMAINTFSGRHFAASQVQLFEGIARHVAVAIESADLYRTQQEEAQIEAALARIAEEMISSLDTPVLLERLCRITTEELECDTAHTFLRETAGDVFVPMCSYGDTQEQWQATQVLRIPHAAIRGLLERLEAEPVVQIDHAAVPRDNPITRMVEQFGVTRTLFVPLRSGKELIGILVASHRGRTEAFDRRQERIAVGIARLASLGLQNARLVEQLDQANRIKAHFVAIMSHELRNPLGTIIGYTDMLIDRALGEINEEQAETLERVRKNAVESLDLITATLDLSRFEARRVPLDVQEVDVAALVEEVAREIRVPPEKQDLELRWSVTFGLPPLHTDPVKLRMVLKNLAGNAVKFTEHGEVVLQARAVEGGVELSVRDTGIGIPADQLANLFQPFTQAHGSVSRRKGGAGLGLYIVKRLLEILGGTLAVESEPGVGSTFRVTIPLGA